MTLSPLVRTGLFYFTLFMTTGASTAYGAIWFAAQGLSDAEIGLAGALPVFVMLVVNLAVGRIADRAKDWRQTIVACAVLSGLAPFGLIWWNDFAGILVFWTLALVGQMALVPVIDAAAIRYVARNGGNFGLLRAGGTVGYLLVIVATGYLADRGGPDAFLAFFLAVGTLRAVTGLMLPAFRAPDGRVAPGGATRLSALIAPWFLLPVGGWALVFSTHLILNVFQGLLWERQGIALGTIGLLIALGALAETVMMMVFARFAPRFRYRDLILVSGVVTVLRWIAFAQAPGVGWLIPLQLLHGITYGMGFMACIGFITRWTNEDMAAEAQSFFVVLQQGFSVLTLYGFGWLVAAWGFGAYWASAAVAALACLAILAARWADPPADLGRG